MVKRTRKPRMRKISTFDEAVTFLGGDRVVRDWLGIEQRHFATMKCRKQASRDVLLHFYLTLRDRGADPEPAVFGLKSFDRLIMPRAKVRKASGRSTR